MLDLIVGALMFLPGGGDATVGNGINFGNNSNVSVICNGVCVGLPGFPAPGDGTSSDGNTNDVDQELVDNDLVTCVVGGDLDASDSCRSEP